MALYCYYDKRYRLSAITNAVSFKHVDTVVTTAIADTIGKAFDTDANYLVYIANACKPEFLQQLIQTMASRFTIRIAWQRRCWHQMQNFMQ